MAAISSASSSAEDTSVLGANTGSLAGALQRDVRAVLHAIAGSAVEEIRLEHGEFRLRLRRRLAEPAAGAPIVAAHDATELSDVSAEGDSVAANLVEIRSAYVGIFHSSREPGGMNLVEPGAHVDAGSAVGVIETLGMSGDVECPTSGTLVEVLASDGQPVEYGQALAFIQPD